ncbi:sugar 3,4-ketoisomerase [Spirosoma harenae]
MPNASLLDKVPFPVQRLYWIYGVPAEAIRGTHAHRVCQEHLLLLNGKLTINLRSTAGELSTYILTESGEGLYIPTMHWKEIHFSTNTIVLVAASDRYDPDDYIYEEEFNQLCLQVA